MTSARADVKNNIIKAASASKRLCGLVGGLKPKLVAAAFGLTAGSLVSTSVTAASVDLDAAQAFLASLPENGYTVQTATIHGAAACAEFTQKTPETDYCLQSSTVQDRWFAVTGSFERYADAQLAAAGIHHSSAMVNSVERLRRTRAEMSLDASQTEFASAAEAAATEPFVSPATIPFSQLQHASLSPRPDVYSAAAEHGDSDHGEDHGEDHGSGGHHIPRLSSEPKPFLTEKELGTRTAPLIEWGGAFLGTGNIRKGFVLPTGAVWTPQFWVYGTGRSALQTYERPGDTSSTSEWANRLDLFGNLQLSGTERLLIGISPLHREDVNGPRFSGEIFSPDELEGSVNRFNGRVRTLFFEGDLAELFPLWDARDGKQNDVGFTIGRQGVLFQDGMTINDTLDAFGLSKNNIRFEGVPWLVNWRTSFLYAWDEVNRGNNQADESAEMYALFNQWDTLKSTIDLDLIYVDSDDETDQLVASLAFIQRLGKIGSTFRIAHSAALDEESAAAGDGTLLFGELNYVPAYTHDNMYLNFFASFDNYTSASRDPLGGGPLGRVGLLYAASGLGTYPSALSNSTNDAYGFSAGYQKLDGKKKRQYILEVGARDSDDIGAEYGIAARFQQALTKRIVLQIDGFVADRDDFDTTYGARVELLLKL